MSADNTTISAQPNRERWADMADAEEPKSPRNPPHADEDRSQVDPVALRLAETFYDRYKRAIHALHHRLDLQKLYDDTFDSWVPQDSAKADFSKVLFAMAREMKIVKVADHGRKLLWKANMPQRRDDERRPPRDEVRPREERIDEHRPRNYNNRERDYEHRPTRYHEDRPRNNGGRNYDERPRHQEEHRRNYYEDRQQPRYNNNRQPPARGSNDVAEIKRNQDKMNELIRNQQKMIETLMSVSKVLNH